MIARSCSRSATSQAGSVALVMDTIAESASVSDVLLDRACATSTSCEQERGIAPPTGFFPRPKAEIPYIYRKIRQMEQENWGQEAELTLKPHRCVALLTGVPVDPVLSGASMMMTNVYRSRLERDKDAAQVRISSIC
jgi:hypothetical protein